MLYKSTRGGESGVSFEKVLFSAYAKDGGLYVPETVPVISHELLYKWRNHTFSMICAEILHIYTDIDINVLNDMTTAAYACFNNGNTPLPMTRVGNLIFLDASLGPTLAFKDVGQQIVARLLNHYLQGNSKVAKIMVDTSGKNNIMHHVRYLD
jgi:threonine synthase